MPTNRLQSVSGQSDNGGALLIQVDTGKHTNVVVTCAVICCAATLIACWAWKMAHDGETESRLTQYYLQDPSYRTPEELASYAKFRQDRSK